MLFLICSTSILGMILHHIGVMVFFCFLFFKVPFELTFCTFIFLSLVFMFHNLGLKLIFPLFWLVCVFWKYFVLIGLCFLEILCLDWFHAYEKYIYLYLVVELCHKHFLKTNIQKKINNFFIIH